MKSFHDFFTDLTSDQRHYELCQNNSVEAISFAKWIKKNYSIVKGGRYRHRGDFHRNHKLLNEEQLFEIFKKLENGTSNPD